MMIKGRIDRLAPLPNHRPKVKPKETGRQEAIPTALLVGSPMYVGNCQRKA